MRYRMPAAWLVIGAATVCALFGFVSVFALPWAEDLGTPWALDQSWRDWLAVPARAYLQWGGRYLCYASSPVGDWLMRGPWRYGVFCLASYLLFGALLLGLARELTRRQSLRLSLGLGFLLWAAMSSALSSFDQMFCWMSNIFSGTLAVAGILIAVYFLLRFYRHCHFTFGNFAGMLFGAWLAPGFYEHGALAGLLLALVCVAVALNRAQHRKALYCFAGWCVFWTGFALIAPGNFARQSIHAPGAGLFESLFMAARTLMGLLGHTLWSPWPLVFLVLALLGADDRKPLFGPRTRWFLSLLPLFLALKLTVLHFLARYPVEFETRTGGTALMLFTLSCGFTVWLWRGELASGLNRFPRLAAAVPWLALLAVLISANTRETARTIFSGRLFRYHRAMTARLAAYEWNRGAAELTVEPLVERAWPAQKTRLNFPALGRDMGSEYAPLRYGIAAITVRPAREELLAELGRARPGRPLEFPGGAVTPALLPDAAGTGQDFLLLAGSSELLRCGPLRVLLLTGPSLFAELLPDQFRRLSPQMALTVWVTGGNHRSSDTGAVILCREPPLLAIPLNRAGDEPLTALWFTLDGQTYHRFRLRP